MLPLPFPSKSLCIGDLGRSHFLSHKRYEQEYGPHEIRVANTIPEVEQQLRRLLSLSDDELLSARQNTRAWAERFHSFEAVGTRLKEKVYGI